MIFCWSHSKSPKVSRTLLSILVNLNNTLVWMVLILFLVSCSCSLFIKYMEIVPSAQTTIGITVILMSLSFCSSLGIFKYLSVRFLLFCDLPEQQNSQITNYFFLLINTSPGIVDPFESQNLWDFCASSSLGRTLAGACTICCMFKFYFLYNSKWTTIPTHSCLMLHSFCGSFLHSFM